MLMRSSLEQCEIMNTVQQNAVWFDAVSHGWHLVVKCPSKQQSCHSREGILYCFGFRLECLPWEGVALPSAEKGDVLSNGLATLTALTAAQMQSQRSSVPKGL